MNRRSQRAFAALCLTFVTVLLIWTESSDWYGEEIAQVRVGLEKTNVKRYGRDSERNITQLSGEPEDSRRLQLFQLKNVQQKLSLADVQALETGSLFNLSPSLNTSITNPKLALDEPRNRARVLLMSYMRSGSTFTGDIFQAASDVFYLYEPLLYVNDDDFMAEKHRPARSRLMTEAVGLRDAPELHNYTLDTLNCKLTDHNLRFLFGMRFSNSTKEFGVCKKAMGIKAETYGECGQNLRSRCEQSSAVVSKILRLKMWEIERMIVEDPDLKVIHLVRDPRGVSVSRNLVHYYFSDAAFCARLNQDSRVSARLQTQYPGRILTTRYEDLATDPTAIAKLLFDFARIPWSEAMERKVWKMTSNSDKRLKEDSFSTMRKNSSLTAFSWRQSIDERSVARLQDLCRQAMEDYGYLPLNSLQELRNQQIPSLTSKFSDKFYKAQVWR